MIVAGCDVGALTTKAVILENGRILGTEIIRSRADSVFSANAVMDSLLANLEIDYSDIDRCVGTGYGRYIVPYADTNVSEISCHGKGAVWLVPSVRTVIDGGGQDYKILNVDETGRLKRFLMTGKCAAGTGRGLELMAEALGVDVSEIGELALKSTNPVTLKPKCSVLTEISIRYLVMEGVPTEDIAAAIMLNVVFQIMVLVAKFDINKDIALTGGIAKNVGIKKLLKEKLETDFVELPVDPQLIGAIGAAVFAAEQLENPDA